VAQAGEYDVVLSNNLGIAISQKTTVTVQPVDNKPGSLDLTFDPGQGAIYQFDQRAYIKALKIDEQDNILIAGRFDSIDGIHRQNLARLKSDGTVDSKFYPQLGADLIVYALEIAGDGKIIIGGTRSHIQRLNPDGTVDASFLLENAMDIVNSVAFAADGGILVGGSTYPAFNGKLACLNEHGGPAAFNVPSIDHPVRCVATDHDAKIYIGGEFTKVNGVERKLIARLHSDGTLDQAFVPDFDIVMYYEKVNCLEIRPDNKLIAGGWFAGNLGLFNSAGDRDRTFGSTVNFGQWIYAIAFSADGKIIVGGDFTTHNNTNCLVRLNADGTVDRTFSTAPAVYGTVNCVDWRCVRSAFLWRHSPAQWG
jgi:uncharacterized delta-60 repeat protein